MYRAAHHWPPWLASLWSRDVRPSVRTTALALAALLSVPASMAVTTAGAAAAPAPCKVVQQGKSGSRSNLQAAIDAAGQGATLIVTGTCSGAYSVDQNLTIKKGATVGVIKGSGGRALHVTGGTLRIDGLRLTGSTAPDCPGYASYLCGAVVYNEGTTILDRVTVSGSTVDGGSTKSVYGAALFNRSGAKMTIKRSIITGNHAVNNGIGLPTDAIIANEGTMSIVRSQVTSNQSSGDTVYGGALYTYRTASRTTIVESTFADNVADAGGNGEGGALEADQGTVTIRRSLFSGNRVSGIQSLGGAMAVNGAVTIEDSTFTGNEADNGGAINADGSSATVSIRGTTIARNSGVVGGGVVQSGTASVVAGSTIIALNTASLSGPDCAGTFTTAQTNLIGKGDGCTGFTNAVKRDKVGSIASPINPKLGLLAANGGSTTTLALLAGSPAIDKAGAAPCDTAKDQRGVKRPKGGACDIGAFEKS